MKPIDSNRVRDMLSRIADAQQKLHTIGNLSEGAFLSDYRNTESAKYLLLVCVASAIDLCNHIVACCGSRAPQNYADCFAILVEVGTITPDLANRLKPMARFRNLLVHQYWQVDNRRIYDIIQTKLDSLSDFRQQVLAWLAGPANTAAKDAS